MISPDLFYLFSDKMKIDTQASVEGRRATRRRRRTCQYEPMDKEEERHLKAALKRSKLEHSMPSVSELPNVVEAPSYQPTSEEFNDPIRLWERLHEHGEKYGAVKLIPPAGWRPKFAMELEKLIFEAREQHLHKLANGKAFSFPKNAWTAETFKKHDEEFTMRHFGTKTPKLEDVEKRYWDIVDRQDEEVTTLYAADLEARKVGSGFPEKTKHPDDPYSHHPWNLVNLPYSDGSLLKYYHREVPGVTSPWIYIGMILSTFCWHTEDNYFAAVNYQHFGAPKIWYIIPPSKAEAMQRVMKEYHMNKNLSSVIHSLSFQISLTILSSQKVPFYRIIQRENEYVLLWPKAFHAGINAGYNCNEACNLAPPFWLLHGYKAVLAYRYMRPMCIPHEQLVVIAARHFKEVLPNRLTFITKAIVQLIVDEHERRQEISLPQFPFHLNAQETTASQNRAGPLLQEFAREMALCCEPSMEAFKSPGISTNNLEDGYDEFLERLTALAKLPAKDCDNCQISCYSGFCMCPHSKDAMCFHCEEALECKCDSRMAVYRLPLPALRTLADILLTHISRTATSDDTKLPDKSEGATSVSIKDLKTALPSMRDLISFESQKLCGREFFDPCGTPLSLRSSAPSAGTVGGCKSRRGSTALTLDLGSKEANMRRSVQKQCYRFLKTTMKEEAEEVHDLLPMAKKSVAPSVVTPVATSDAAVVKPPLQLLSSEATSPTPASECKSEDGEKKHGGRGAVSSRGEKRRQGESSISTSPSSPRANDGAHGIDKAYVMRGDDDKIDDGVSVGEDCCVTVDCEPDSENSRRKPTRRR